MHRCKSVNPTISTTHTHSDIWWLIICQNRLKCFVDIGQTWLTAMNEHTHTEPSSDNHPLWSSEKKKKLFGFWPLGGSIYTVITSYFEHKQANRMSHKWGPTADWLGDQRYSLIGYGCPTNLKRWEGPAGALLAARSWCKVQMLPTRWSKGGQDMTFTFTHWVLIM